MIGSQDGDAVNSRVVSQIIEGITFCFQIYAVNPLFILLVKDLEYIWPTVTVKRTSQPKYIFQRATLAIRFCMRV